MRKVMLLSLALALAGAACSTKTSQVRDPDEGARNVLDVVASEYAFKTSGTVTPGLVTLQFRNAGKEMHHGILGRIDAGKTVEDVKKAILESNDDSGPPSWYHDDPIDVGLTSPGTSASVTFDLKEPGKHVFLCFIPDKTGKPHAASGMIHLFDVAAGDAKAKAPKADVKVQMSEYKFTGVPATLKAGETTFSVTNAGKENHDYQFIRFEPGKTSADIDKWFGSGGAGAPPAAFFGGTHDYAPGVTTHYSITFEPGTYTMICGASTEDGKNHGDDLGMVATFKVT